MLVKIYNIFCMVVAVVLVLVALVGVVYTVYHSPVASTSFLIIAGIFGLMAVAINGYEQLDKFLENRDKTDGN